MLKYLLVYDQPRLAPDASSVVFEIKRISTEWPNDAAAERWAREVVPRAHGLTHSGRHYPARPIELRQGRLILWSNRG
jgi:hypothetical protein